MNVRAVLGLTAKGQVSVTRKPGQSELLVKRKMAGGIPTTDSAEAPGKLVIRCE